MNAVEAAFERAGLRVPGPGEIAEIEAAQRAALAERQKAERRETRERLWAEKCPAIYREAFDFERVDAHADRAALAVVLSWRYGARGLYVLGHTGRSKSRAVGSVLTRCYVEEGRSVQVLDGIQFAIEAGAKLGSPVDASAWLNKLCQPDILWIDDLAKRWTPSTEEAAFGIVERRTSRGLPIIITNNYNKQEMLAKAHDANVVGPMLRRLKDYCEVASI